MRGSPVFKLIHPNSIHLIIEFPDFFLILSVENLDKLVQHLDTTWIKNMDRTSILMKADILEVLKTSHESVQ